MKKFIEENTQNMIDELSQLVGINSEYSDDEKPFGSNNKKVLEKAIELMDKKGFKTQNVDYFACYGEIGEGDKTIGLVAHLDVVPVGEGWNSDPFKLVVKDGRMYGRGTSDDKGAAIASMYAMKYLKDTNYPLKKKVRLILGCNEETGSACIKHYVEKYGSVDMGFTPDGNFPGIYAEKGMVGGTFESKNSKIIDIKGGEATNIVCKKVECVVPLNSFNEDKFKKFLDDNSVEYSISNDENTKIVVRGVSAHASTPDLGVNAINYLYEALYNADFNDSLTDYFHEYIGLTLHGEKMGFEALKDEETNTSFNLGVVSKENDVIKTTLDIRFPVKTTYDKCNELLNKAINDNNKFVIRSEINPLYFDKELPMIKAMDKAYRDVTGDTQAKMQAIGGGTYAKSMDNIIAFGCEFQDDDNHIHDANESLEIEKFKKQVEIYVEAIKNLNEV